MEYYICGAILLLLGVLVYQIGQLYFDALSAVKVGALSLSINIWPRLIKITQLIDLGIYLVRNLVI